MLVLVVWTIEYCVVSCIWNSKWVYKVSCDASFAFLLFFECLPILHGPVPSRWEYHKEELEVGTASHGILFCPCLAVLLL